MPAHSVPPQHQTDPAKMPGQIVNPLPDTFNHDMMDDMALHRFMRPADKTIGDYARRKSDMPFNGATHDDFKPARDLPSSHDPV